MRAQYAMYEGVVGAVAEHPYRFLDGWRIDIGYPEDRDEAERRLQKATPDQVGSQAEAQTD